MAQHKWNLGDIRPADEHERELPDTETRPKAKRPMQDMRTPVGYGTPLNATNTPVAFEEDSSVGSQESPQKFQMRSHTSSGGRGKRVLFFCAIVLVFLLVGFLTTFLLQGAELTVYPKFKDVTVQAAFTAQQNPVADALGYELLTLEETGERTVAATGEENVQEHATGEIILSNAFSKDAQRLIKNTRFESTDGKIFRISDSVVVPGYTTKNSLKGSPQGEKVPGIVTAKVFADTTGDAYNIAPTHFTIPGLKGSPQFDTMSGESKAPMQGGFVGKKLIVEDAVLTSTQKAIQAELKEKLLARLGKERPAGFTLYESAARIRFESLPSVNAGEKQATIREHAVLEAPLFAEADFVRYLAQNTIADYGKEDVRLENAQALTFAYINATSTDGLKGIDKIDFNLSGNAKIVWKYDKEKLRKDLVGVAKNDVSSTLLKNYPAIERATAVMRPFWKQSFPKDPAKIKIVEILDSQSSP